MKLLTDQLEDLVSDVDNINPKTYDYGWQIVKRVDTFVDDFSKTLNLDLLPVSIRRGWRIYREIDDRYIAYEINQ